MLGRFFWPFKFYLAIAVLLAVAFPALAAALREQDIMDLVVNAAVDRLQVSARDVQVTWQDRDAASLLPTLPDGAVTMEIPQSAHLGGKTPVPINIFVNGRRYRTIFPKLDVQIYAQVLVSATRLPRGTLVSRDDIKFERRSVVGMYQQPMMRTAAIEGAETTREIPAGTVLVAQMFRLPTIIKTGDMVTIVLTHGDLTVVANGQARSAGAMGQLIKVMNLDSKREFTARVAGPNRVEIKVED